MPARPVKVTFTGDWEAAARDMRRVKRASGFLGTRHFGGHKIGWRIWAGPLIFARVHGCRTGYWHEKGMGWTLTLFGISLGWAR